MTLMSILAASDNGNYFDGVARVCNMSVDDARSALARMCPAIATQLKSKMQSDNNAFEVLLDLLDEGDDLDGLTNSEAIEDGKAVLEDLYGSPAAALAEMKRLAPGLSDAQYENISAISATSVLAVLAKSYAVPRPLPAVRARRRKAEGYWQQSSRRSSRACCRVPEASLPRGGAGGGAIPAISVRGGARPRAGDGAPRRRRWRIFSGKFLEHGNSKSPHRLIACALAAQACKRRDLLPFFEREKGKSHLLPSPVLLHGRRCPTGRMRALRRR